MQPVVHINDVTHLKEMDRCEAVRAFLLKVIIFESLKKEFVLNLEGSQSHPYPSRGPVELWKNGRIS